MRWLEVNPEGVVVNIVIWDGVSPYQPAGVAQLLSCDENFGVTIGWKIINDVWESPTTDSISQTTNGDNQ